MMSKAETIGIAAVNAFKSLGEIFYDAANVSKAMGMPRDAILLETTATSVARIGMEFERKFREIARQEVDGGPDPLVIMEGDKIQGVEAILVGGARAVFVDWSEMEADPDRARSTYDGIEEYFIETGLEPDERIEGILSRLELIGGGNADFLKAKPGDADYGMEHTGNADCPACKAIAIRYEPDGKGKLHDIIRAREDTDSNR